MHISLKYIQVALFSPVKLFIITDVTSVLRSLRKVMLNTSHFLDYVMHALSFYCFFGGFF